MKKEKQNKEAHHCTTTTLCIENTALFYTQSVHEAKQNQNEGA
jgi:hypothetical protein